MERPGSVGSAQDVRVGEAVLEAEVDALLDRRKSERRQAVNSALGAIAAGNYMIRVAECNGSGDPWCARS